MYVRFWGSRGSLPCSLAADKVRQKLKRAIKSALEHKLESDADIDAFIDNRLPFAVRGTYGGNTPCVEIGDEESFVVCDAGSGLRDFGVALIQRREKERAAVPTKFHLFLSHFHWDHIQGFPFFPQAFVPGNSIVVYGFHEDVRSAFAIQQNPLNFPISLENMMADIEFKTLDPKKAHKVNGFLVKGISQNHPGGSFGFSFEKGGKKVVYSTDSEYRYGAESEQNDRFIGFFKNADLLVFDAQYQLLDAIDAKRNWGHSSNLLGIEFAIRAGAKRLCLFHHEHTSDDDVLEKFYDDSIKYLNLYDKKHALELFLAYDGLQLEI